MTKPDSSVPAMISAGWVRPRSGGHWTGDACDEAPVADVNELFTKEILNHTNVKNHGRFPDGTRAVCSACALALKGAGLWPGDQKRPNTGLLIAGYDHTLMQNCSFFQDYIDNDRIIARGQLFIYTLPTSAVAEAAILLKAEGPLLFEESGKAPFANLLNVGEGLINSGQAERMMLVWQNTETTLCGLLDGTSAGASGNSNQHLITIAQKWNNPVDGIDFFRDQTSGRNEKERTT
ncbi:MAG: hypothetical protein ACLFWL_07690 [Candidatus Brocadiia bacterium]